MPSKSKTKKRFQQLKAQRVSQQSDLIPVDKEARSQQQHLSGKKGNGPKVWWCGAHVWLHKEGPLADILISPIFRGSMWTLQTTWLHGPSPWTTAFQFFHVAQQDTHTRPFPHFVCPERALKACIVGPELCLTRKTNSSTSNCCAATSFYHKHLIYYIQPPVGFCKSIPPSMVIVGTQLSRLTPQNRFSQQLGAEFLPFFYHARRQFRHLAAAAAVHP